MGVCINYEFLQRRKDVKKILDRSEKFAKILSENLAKVIEVPMMVRRTSDYELLIDIKGCETLAFSFGQVRDLEDWEYNSTNLVQLAEQKNESLEKHYKNLRANGYTEFSFYDDELLIANGFCKTQYGKPVCHRFVAEIVRHVASQSFASYVFDEGDYYYTQDISDAENAQKEVQDILDGLVGKLTR